MKLNLNGVALWAVRKALYTVGGAVVAAVAVKAKLIGGPDYNLQAVTQVGSMGGFAAAALGDLRRAFLPDLFQVISGQDPRKDG